MNESFYYNNINKRVDELSIYYLYFLCSFMDKMTEKLKNVKIDKREKIEFRKFLSDEFIKECDNITIQSVETIGELNTFKDIKINFCERFIYIINKFINNRNINCKTLRDRILEDVIYISFHFFGIVIKEININIENIIEFFDDMVYDIVNKKINDTIFSLKELEHKAEDEKLSNDNSNNKYNDITEDLDFYDTYLCAKEILNEKIITYNRKIGYRIVNFILNPILEQTKLSNITNCYGLSKISDSYLTSYFNLIQNEYYLKHVNNILLIKDVKGVTNYFDKNQCNFIELSALEDLIKNE